MKLFGTKHMSGSIGIVRDDKGNVTAINFNVSSDGTMETHRVVNEIMWGVRSAYSAPLEVATNV